MPKLKTKKGIKKRFRMTKTGKFKHGKAGKGHLLSSKSQKRKRKLKMLNVVDKSRNSMLRTMLPYGGETIKKNRKKKTEEKKIFLDFFVICNLLRQKGEINGKSKD